MPFTQMRIPRSTGLTSRRVPAAFAAALVLFAGSINANAQTPAQEDSSRLSIEIQNLEQQLSGNLSPTEKHSALVRLARLRQLSGNAAVAAVHYLEAAGVDPSDEASLVTGAYCLAAVGEWERAMQAVAPVLVPGKSGMQALRASYLSATLRAWTQNDLSDLVSLAGNAGAAPMLPVIYYTLWWTANKTGDSHSAEIWKQRLAGEFSQSPEAKIVAQGSAISAVHSPLWLLLPGSGTQTAQSTTAQPATAVNQAPVQQTPPSQQQPAVQPQTAANQPAVQPPAPVRQTAQQTGLFRNEANAVNQANSLRAIGFAAQVYPRTVNGTAYWAVAVPSGDPEKTAGELKNAGHDSFTVRLD